MVELPRCETCKHFWPGGAIRTHSRYSTQEHADACRNEQLWQYNADDNAGGSYDQEMSVPPDFGCVLHEPKEEADGR